MARIRTVKPDFLRHYGLYLAEAQAKLPLRLAFLGLWTAADREGRFKWIPAVLKLDCLPHDQVDFAEVLECLRSGGWIIKYSDEQGEYGYIPSWKKHQCINAHEAASTIPNPCNCEKRENSESPSDARASMCMHENARGERKGKEGNKEGKGFVGAKKPRPTKKAPCDFVLTAEMREWASKEFPDVDVELATACFKDHEFRTGKTDWIATWRNWIRNSVLLGNSGRQVKKATKDYFDRLLEEKDE
jgi:hypothetical protein